MAIRWQDHVEERTDVMRGKPTFKGTRLTVEHVLKEMGLGMTDAELLDNYPTLRPEHIRAGRVAGVSSSRPPVFATPHTRGLEDETPATRWGRRS